MKISIDKSYSWNNIIFDIIRLFTSQDLNIFKSNQFIFKIRNKATTFITMVILIFFTVIITKCLTSLLLNTYFKLIKVTVVDSLEELIEGDQCLIASMNRTFDFLKMFKLFEQKQIEVLKEKKEKYQQTVEFDLNGPGALYEEGVFSDMVRGKTIILETTLAINYFVDIYKRQRDQFVTSEHKYINQRGGHYINKKSFIKEKQKFGFVSSIFYISKNIFQFDSKLIIIYNYYNFSPRLTDSVKYLNVV